MSAAIDSRDSLEQSSTNSQLAGELGDVRLAQFEELEDFPELRPSDIEFEHIPEPADIDATRAPAKSADSFGTGLPIPTAGRPVDYFVDLAVAGHPRIQAARARAAAASARIPQARSLEDPMLSSTSYPISDQALQTAAGRAGTTISISQKYPWPRTLRVRAAIADRELQMAWAKVDQGILEIEEAVRLAYYELWFADRAISIVESNRQVAVELVRLAEERNRAGGSLRDVRRAELQLDAIDDRLITLRRQKGVAQADLAALIQQPDLSDIEPTQALEVADVPGQIDALLAAAVECNPRLQERLAAISRDRQKVQLACLGGYPDITLGAAWQSITESDAISAAANGHDNVSFMAGMTLPIWRGRINASVREASSNATASSRAYEDAFDDTYRQIRRLTEQAVAADEQLRLVNERIVPRARQALQLAAADYQGQLADFGEVADGFIEVLMFELQAVRARATLAGALAQLERAVGCEVVAVQD